MDIQLTIEEIKLLNILEEFYRKAENAETHPLHTTNDIFEKLQSIYPSEEYNTGNVMRILIYGEYDKINSSTGSMLWLIQEKP